MDKHHDEMTVEEARDECYRLEAFFDSCGMGGYGISTKDTVRHRACKAMIDLHDKFGIGPSEYQGLEGGVLAYMASVRRLFTGRALA